MTDRLRYIVTLLLLAGLFSCSLTKYVPEGDALYKGARITVEDSTLSREEKSGIREEMEKLPRPLPNRRFLGIPFKLILYNIGGAPQKGGFFRRFFHKAGEPPVLLSKFNLNYNTELIQNHLENEGYFQVQVQGDTVVKKKKAYAHFIVTPNLPYVINNVTYDVDTGTALGKTIALLKQYALLRKGDRFNLETIKAERISIDAILKQKGYYYFNPDFLIVNADSTIGNRQIDVHLLVKENTPEQALIPYKTDSIFIYTNYRLVQREIDSATQKRISYQHDDFYIIGNQKSFKPKLFEDAIILDSGSIYNLNYHNASLNRLISLDVFKYVQNKFSEVPTERADTGKLNVSYYLSRKPKKSLKLELLGSTKSNDFVGTQAKLTFRNRNTFKAAEHLDIFANIGTEFQYGGNKKGYNTLDIGFGARLTFPRFITPFYHFETRNAFLPKTTIEGGYEILDKRGLFTLRSIKGELGYSWKPNYKAEHNIVPISINFIKPQNVTQKYRDSILTDPILAHAIDDQFIFGSNYSFTINELINNPKSSGVYFNGLLDLSGNIAGLFTKRGAGEKKRILGNSFAQYAKTQFDLRYYFLINRSVQWVNRVFAGAGFPYGNSEQLPYIKQYFAGGTNSLRGFRSRTVGPGSFRSARANERNYFADQSGDIKIELNSEFRFYANKYIEPAIFFDAGNIWLFNSDINQPGGQIKSDFLNDMAVDAGAGLRLNFQILVVRLDVAIPMRKPWLTGRSKWVLDEINFGNRNWRRENIVFNLAIGYPF